ncbi:hypothetical protein EW146_g343 [Bondarzewia mesenterica]|uniref:CUE domain-containing protein n=1 Tax=Bondarzewia mesenterica TaxID=1095465 RepID=A0A4S4M777_9AGAM|nr:hypothetical protein EW146_g343 [Bondarzewia mesenterica]
MTIAALPPYPSSRARASLSPSQLASLHQKICHGLQDTLALPPNKRDNPATATFISSYVRDVAQSTLQSLIWDASDLSKSSKTLEIRAIHSRVLLLAERLAPSGLLDLQTLFDLTIAYSTHPTRLRSLFASAFNSNSGLSQALETSALPAFTAVLQPTFSSGLYGLRKSSHCLLCLFRALPPSALTTFAHSKLFLLAFATAYDAGLASIAQSYGGLRLDISTSASSATPTRVLDEWERLFLETKVALIDAFHLLFKSLLSELSQAQGPALPSASEQIFDNFFSILEIPSPPSNANAPPTSFLNQPLLVDYQHAYDLSHLLERTLNKAAADDARLEFITMSLRSFDASSDSNHDPGALRLLLGSGLPPGIDSRGRRPVSSSDTRSITRSAPSPVAGPSSSADKDDVDLKVSEVLSILPDHSPAYIRGLLLQPEFNTVERVVQALLEGTAPSPSEVEREPGVGRTKEADVFKYTKERRNVFDDEVMDLSKVRVGKKSEDADTVLRDRAEIELMKADILRRAEELSDSEEEEEEVDAYYGGNAPSAKGKGLTVAFDEELDDIDAVKVGGDGEESGEDDDEDQEGEGSGSRPGKVNPETVLELAYITNPAVFEKDAATKRGKERATLRAKTGWSDEQIQGWKSMLDRNPKLKEKVLQKHEFSGNKPLSAPPSAGPSRSQTPDGSQPARGRGGGGRGGGRGRGRGGSGSGGGGGGGQGSEQRERAWKDKNKARRGNHNRKRGHDQKMNRAGGPS